MRLLAVTAAVAIAAMTMSSCGGGSGSNAKIAFLQPGTQAPAREVLVRLAFEKKVEERCGGCKIIYGNAQGSAAKQESQAEVALRKGAKVLVIEPVDVANERDIVEKSKGEHVPIISYDRLLLNSRVDYYVSYEKVEVGELQGESLSKKVKEDGHPKGPVIMINGDVEDVDASNYRYGAQLRFKANGVEVAEEYTTVEGSEKSARREMQQAIAALGDNGFAGVFVADDEIAGGAIKAMEAAGIDPQAKPTTGEGATVAGLQRILTGQQYMTVYRPVNPEARVGAEFAVDLAESGEVPTSSFKVEGSNGLRDVPQFLLKPVAVTKANLKQTVIADGLVTPAELCTGPSVKAC